MGWPERFISSLPHKNRIPKNLLYVSLSFPSFKEPSKFVDTSLLLPSHHVNSLSVTLPSFSDSYLCKIQIRFLTLLSVSTTLLVSYCTFLSVFSYRVLYLHSLRPGSPSTVTMAEDSFTSLRLTASLYQGDLDKVGPYLFLLFLRNPCYFRCFCRPPPTFFLMYFPSG